MISFNHWSGSEAYPQPFLGSSVLLGHWTAVTTRLHRALAEYFTKLSFFLKPCLAQLAHPFQHRFISFSPRDKTTVAFSKNHNITCWKMVCSWGTGHSFLYVSHKCRVPDVPSFCLLTEMCMWLLLLPVLSHRGKGYPGSWAIGPA